MIPDQPPTQWACATCRDTGLVPAGGFGGDGTDACPDCTPDQPPTQWTVDDEDRLAVKWMAEMGRVVAERNALAHTLQQARQYATEAHDGWLLTNQPAPIKDLLNLLTAEAGAVTRAEDTEAWNESHWGQGWNRALAKQNEPVTRAQDTP